MTLWVTNKAPHRWKKRHLKNYPVMEWFDLEQKESTPPADDIRQCLKTS